MAFTIMLILAAGKGERAGGVIPKQFALLGGRRLIDHSCATLAAHPRIDRVFVVVAPGSEAAPFPGVDMLPVGGATRRLTVANALEAIARTDEAGAVLIHDAARALIPDGLIDRLLDELPDHEGAIPVLPVADTLARGDVTLGETVPRDRLYRVQTPQAFRFAAILDAHRRWTDPNEPTDDAQMVRRLGGAVALVQGDVMLDKITHPQDFATAEARLAYETRSASGFDVHRLENGEELWLGGVLVPHDKGLSGHSDADVALHALTDALLGAIAAGDIGTHFPPSDPQWKGADSARFLRHAAGLIAAKGGRIDFVDLTIICEAPKIGPHREAIRARIGDLLGLSPDRVSIKATTTERLGFTGRGEGIAAQAMATVSVPR